VMYRRRSTCHRNANTHDLPVHSDISLKTLATTTTIFFLLEVTAEQIYHLFQILSTLLG
jgi:hypothetical protein